MKPACINIYVNNDQGWKINRVKEAGSASSSNIPSALLLKSNRKILINVVATKTPTLMYISWIKTFPLRKASFKSAIICAMIVILFSPVHNQNKSEYHSSQMGKMCYVIIGVIGES